MKTFIRNYINDSISIKEKILNNPVLLSDIEKTVKIITEAYKKGKKILAAGNGGSACDAQHIAAELVSKFFLERPALSAIALTTNTSILTSVGNDYNHELVFARQIQAHANEGDVFIAVSTSGNSKNIIRAAEEASKRKVTIIGLTGEKPCKLDRLADVIIKIPSGITPAVQEAHLMIEHIICSLTEKEMFKSEKN